MGQVGGISAVSALEWVLGAGTIFLFASLVRPAINSRRWSIALDLSREAITMSVLGLVFLLVIFRSPVMVAAVLFAVAVHEYGHVLAYRLIGHSNPKFQFVPFGGVAYSGQHYGSNREAFFVAMMGPGFSLILVVALLLVAKGLVQVNFELAHLAFLMAFWVGILNAINLLPLYPFDGGRALQSIVSNLGPTRMRSTMMVATSVTTGLIVVVAIANGMWFLLIFALIGLLQADRHIDYAAALPRMSKGDAWLCALIYIATLLALGYLARNLLLAQVVGSFKYFGGLLSP
ncbi:MAG: hypothetical protein MRY74_01115 [Neomegalonema sp.]|nr:hypothetical protein [Neomegalonema sp.]